jgi:two-component system NarL family response regulator
VADHDNPIRVLIADDHLVYRLGIRTLLSIDHRFTVAGEAANAENSIQQFKLLQPQVVLLDLRMPHGGGLAVVKALKKLDTAVRILVITSFEMEEEVFQIIQAGALGYILKDAGRDFLIEAILAVAAGKSWIPVGIASQLEERNQRKQLTARELQIVELLVRGLTNQEIASVLAISESTVKNHISSVLNKLEVTDRTEAASFCLAKGIIRVEDL